MGELTFGGYYLSEIKELVETSLDQEIKIEYLLCDALAPTLIIQDLIKIAERYNALRDPKGLNNGMCFAMVHESPEGGIPRERHVMGDELDLLIDRRINQLMKSDDE